MSSGLLDPAVSDASQQQSSDCVRVAVRVRPLNAREKAAIAESKVSWSINSTSITQCIGERPVAANSFAFDNVFQETTNNEQVFSTLAKPVAESAVDGLNGVIFAYGQTAAGKTYTMLGTESDPGVTKRSISAVFAQIAAFNNRQFLLRASYIEIYNEVIRDLLSPGSDNLKIHEDVINKRVFVDSREEVVTSVQDVMSIIAAGEQARAVGVTNMNDRSSRSHTIFSLKIESREMSSPDPDQDSLNIQNDGVAVRQSTLSLVDLAGSERASFTKAQGMRLVEGGHINKSLLTLGTVINKLSSGETSIHIPYRDSKLTRILQPALGGNARTAIICAVTPAILHMEETLSTLKFASRAKKVTNHASANEYLDDRAKLRRAEKELGSLRKEVQRLSAQSGQMGVATSGVIAPGTIPTDYGEPESRTERISNFTEKFQTLLSALHKCGNATMESKHMVASAGYEECSFPSGARANLRSALDLASSEVERRPMGLVDAKSDQIETELRGKVFEIEKEKRLLVAEIEYERLAMNAEVDALVTANMEAERSRMEAQRECDEAMVELAQAQAASLVDEIVSESISASLVSKELQRAHDVFEEMGLVKSQNESLKTQMSVVEKEHADMVKREKRGVGPVIKERNLLKSKLSESESKLRNIRQASSKAMSEKAALEKEIKDRDRKLKVLNGEVERHRNHGSLAQNRVSKEVAEEKRRCEASLMKADEEVKSLQTKLCTVEASLVTKQSKVHELEQELADLTAEKNELLENSEARGAEAAENRAKLNQALCERDGLSKSLVQAEEKEVSALQEIAKLSKSLGEAKEEALSTLQKMDTMAEELGQVHLKLEETKAELSEVIKVSEEREALHQSSLHSSEQEHVEQMAASMAERHKLEEMMLSERGQKQDHLGTVTKLEREIEELQEGIQRLELSSVESKSQTEELLEARNALEKRCKVADARILELSKAATEAVEQACPSCEASATELSAINEKCKRLEEEIRAVAADEESTALEKSTCEMLQKQNQDLYAQREHLLIEGKGTAKEMLRLSETIQARDKRIYALEDKLAQYGRGEGAVAKLSGRVQRRDIIIADLSRRLKVLQELVDTKGLSESFREADRICGIEANNEALRATKERLEESNDQLQREKRSLIEESRKLREVLKAKDVMFLRRKVQQKEELLDSTVKQRHASENMRVN